MIFFHGIGIGVSVYLDFIWKMSSSVHRDIYLLELHHVNMSPSFVPITMEEIFVAVEEILAAPVVAEEVEENDDHSSNNSAEKDTPVSFRKAVFVGHSFGTIPVAQLTQHRSHLVAGKLLLLTTTVHFSITVTSLPFI